MTIFLAGRTFNHYFFSLLFFNVLVYCYINYNVPVWGYLGYEENFSFVRYALSSLLVFALRYFTPKYIAGFSDFVLALLSCTIIVSMLAIYAARGFSAGYMLSVFLFYLTLYFFGKKLCFRIPARRSSVYPFLGVSFLLVLFVAFNILVKGGIGSLSIDFSSMYENRDAAIGAYFSGFFAYLNNWAIKIFAPAILAYGIVKRSPFLVFFAVIVEVFFFAAFQQKTPLLFLFFIPFCLWVSRSEAKVYYFDAAFVTLFVITALVYLVFDIIEPMAVFQHRAFFAPAMINVYYYEFFSSNEFVYFSNSFLSGLIKYPYDQHVFDLISIAKTGDVGVNPNTGILGTGYMHLGYIGMILYAVSGGFFLMVLNSLSKTIPLWVALSLAFPPFYILMTSADFSVSLLTNGLLIAVFVLFFWPAQS